MRKGDVDIRLSELHEVASLSSLDRRAIRRYGGSRIDVGLNVRMESDVKNSTVTMVVGVAYNTTRHIMRERLLQYTVAAEFEVDSLSEHLQADGVEAIVSAQLMRLMLSVTIGSLRGMLALRTASTKLAAYPMPIFDLTEIISRMSYDDGSVKSPFTQLVSR